MLLRDNGHLLLTDFGLAKILAGDNQHYDEQEHRSAHRIICRLNKEPGRQSIVERIYTLWALYCSIAWQVNHLFMPTIRSACRSNMFMSHCRLKNWYTIIMSHSYCTDYCENGCQKARSALSIRNRTYRCTDRCTCDQRSGAEEMEEMVNLIRLRHQGRHIIFYPQAPLICFRCGEPNARTTSPLHYLWR